MVSSFWWRACGEACPVRDVSAEIEIATETVESALTSEPALLHPTERAGGIEAVVGVQPHDPGLESTGDLEDLAALVGPDPGRETEAAVVRTADRLLGGSKAHDREHRTEDLLPRDGVVRFDDLGFGSLDCLNKSVRCFKGFTKAVPDDLLASRSLLKPT